MMMFKASIMECMKKMFGLVGPETWGFDLIYMKNKTALLRVSRSYVDTQEHSPSLFSFGTSRIHTNIHTHTHQTLDTGMDIDVSRNSQVLR